MPYTVSSAQITQDLDDLYTTTWRYQRKEAIEQILTKTAFWFWLYKEKGRKKYVEGGRFISIPLKYGRNNTFKMMNLAGTIDLSRDEKLTDAIYDWKYAAVSVVRYWIEDLQNRGKQKIIDIMNVELDAAKEEIAQQFEEQVFGSGAGDDIEGLGNLVNTAGTGTVGGIDSSSKTWWKNQFLSMSGKQPGVWLDKYMRQMLNDCSKGQNEDVPDFFVTTQDIYEMVEDNTLEQHRIYNKSLGDAQFNQGIEFKGRPIIWSDQANSGNMYALNSKYLELIIDPAADFDMTEWKAIPNQVKDRAAQICIALNFITTKRSAQGVIHSISA